MSYLFMCVSVWSKQCSPIRLFPERSRPPLPVYVNSSPRSCSGSRPQPILAPVCSKSQACLHRNHTNDPPLHPQSPPPTPVNKSRRYSARGSHLHAACEHLLHSPEVADGLNSDTYVQQHFKRKSYLNSELPGGSNRNSGNGPVMVRRNNGALLSAPHTGHALQLHPQKTTNAH